MGILDLLKSFIPVPPSSSQDERLGPNDLPSDVWNDLRRGNSGNLRGDVNNENPSSSSSLRHSDEDVSVDDITQFHDGRHRQFPGDEQHFQQHFHTNIQQDFEDAFKEMDDVFKSFFGGGFGTFGGGCS